ncbi:DUF3427 domain-containing protein [Amphibacillus cookii]|uniref:DUF3427 domain-containing protein n=1 Tax=Amphibacillus cookii TaxID=767787 RepID=UPI0019588E76|nr:DEAD/DEAH box helicase [Amphibacillus cookii]MBM7541183.1 superfamily II DNA or RNA helicase/HKD family nuclease [Amphibacillus cookii]
MENFLRHLEDSLHKGFINREYGKVDTYKPKLLVNNTRTDENVLSSLLEELNDCQSFFFSVAFITESGLATLKTRLLALKEKGITGRILTSTYLSFNQPKAFKELLKVTNVEIRLTDLHGFHSKGYIFDRGHYFTLIVGSSNLTAAALKQNYEWNVHLTSHENGDVIHHFKHQYEEVWGQSVPLTQYWINEYEKSYQSSKYQAPTKVAELPSNYHVNSIEASVVVEPNQMQEAALEQIEALRNHGSQKGLVISATGTGKTYLAAFDVRRFAPKRMLFVVHREQILRKAKADFQRVLGGIDRDFGILAGKNKDLDARYLFTSIQTLAKQEMLMSLDPKAFNYILVDEVHKAGAESYLKVLNYFNPEFLLGMTATPERTDDFNIYQLFDYQVAYEIRLQEALNEDMLCPFHYFGVTELEYNGQLIDDRATLTTLVTNERVDYIIEKINYYGFSGEYVKGLIFCSRTKEAKKLSEAFNVKGFRTAVLTGADNQKQRFQAVNALEQGQLDYIMTVDIFNEGIDIPSVNQVVMLRQTQSSIVFIQQLGRGLRKHESKEFVTIIDFIGNYKNNYMIPLALSGDQSLNKDNIRRHTHETSFIKGVSTINFESKARKQIFKSINRSHLTELKRLKETYFQLKNRLGRIPFLVDFISNHSIDPTVLVDKYGSYYVFLLKLNEIGPLLNTYEQGVIMMISMELLNGKRKHELLLLRELLEKDNLSKDAYKKLLAVEQCSNDDQTLHSVERILDLSFFTQTYRKKYGVQAIIKLLENGFYTFNETIRDRIIANPYFKQTLADVLSAGLARSNRYHTQNPLTRYEKYTRKDACRLLNWDNDESGTIFGYKTKHQTCPIFVTYDKDTGVESSVNYDDQFLSQEVLKWFTRSRRTLQSTEVQKIVQAQEQKIAIHLFVKKSDDEGKSFYYLGQALPDQHSIAQANMLNENGEALPVVHMNMILAKPVDTKIYHYLVSSDG